MPIIHSKKMRSFPIRWPRRRVLQVIGLGLCALFFILTGERLRLAHPDPHRIRFAHTFTTESERAILADVILEFQSRFPSIRVEQSIANSEVYNNIGWRIQFQGRNQPDIYFHWQGYKVDWCVDRGLALNLLPHLSPGFMDEFVDSAMDVRSGQLYFLPHSIDICNLVWYNRSLFKERQLEPPRSSEQWVDLCRTLRDQRILPLAQGNRDLWPMGNFASELLGQSLGAEGSAGLFEPGAWVADEARVGLRFLEELRLAGAFDLPGVLEPGAVGSLSDIDAKVLFLTGRSAMHLLGTWFLADIQDAHARGELGFEVDLFPVPPAIGEQDAMTGVTTGYLVNPSSANTDACVAFLELLLSRKYQARFAALGALSLRKDARDFTEHALAQAMLDILADAVVVVPPPDTGYRPDEANAFYDVVGRVLTGKLGLENVAQEWNRQKQRLTKKGF